jgi:hypothetical protein
MALVTKPKPTISHKKRRAQHHRHSRHYLQPYWPYLPILAVVVGGAIVNELWTAGLLPGVTGSTAIAAGSQLTRVQALAGGQANDVLAVVIIVSGAAFATFVFRHWRRLRRFINEGEAIAYRYAWIDATMILICTVGFLLTRPDTFIR